MRFDAVNAKVNPKGAEHMSFPKPFFTSNIILSGKTLHTVIPAIPVPTATVIGAITATLIGIIGYHFIHKFFY